LMQPPNIRRFPAIVSYKFVPKPQNAA